MRDSADELRVFADNVPAMIVSWDENLCCRFASKPYIDFFSPADRNIVGRHFREVVGETVYRKSEDRFAKARSERLSGKGDHLDLNRIARVFEQEPESPPGRFQSLKHRLVKHGIHRSG